MELVGYERDRAELLTAVAGSNSVRELAAALFHVTGPGDTDEGFVDLAESAIHSYLSASIPAGLDAVDMDMIQHGDRLGPELGARVASALEAKLAGGEVTEASIPRSVSDAELSQWAEKRADDAGRLARELLAYRRASLRGDAS